jgi:competence ComEA-like helix-hairpin-helix protein
MKIAVSRARSLRASVPLRLCALLLSLCLCALLSPAAALALTGQLNVNTATLEELQQLPFIGANRAQAIMDYRRDHGGFRTLAELRRSEAIGDSAFEAIKHYLVLTGPTTLHRNENQRGAAAGLLSGTHPFLTHQGEILLLPDADYYETLLQHIRQAQHRIDLSMFIFKITGSPRNRPAIVLQELTAAHKRGVEVNVLLERSDNYDDLNRENRKTAEIMQSQGIKVTFARPQRTNHTKLVVVDGRYSFVGSHNLTHAALARNSELSLLIDNPRLAEELRKYIAGIQAER